MRSSWTRVDSKSITNLMDMSLNKPPEILEGREAWRAAVHGVAKIRKRFSNWTTTITKSSDRCPSKNITWGHRNTETQMILPQNAEAETEWCGCKPRNAWVCPSSRKLAERHASHKFFFELWEGTGTANSLIWVLAARTGKAQTSASNHPACGILLPQPKETNWL